MKLSKVLKGNTCNFEFYRSGQLWYEIKWVDEAGLIRRMSFSIPITDTGTGTFKPKMTAISLMRWIRKNLESYHKDGIYTEIQL